MASTEGILIPSSHVGLASSSITLSGKRKRDDSNEGQNHTNGTSDSKLASRSVLSTLSNPQRMINDLIDILKAHDTIPSILKRPLPERASATEPQAKRHKAEGSANPNTILTRHSLNTYSAVEEVLDDIDLVVSDISEKLQLPNAAKHPVPPSPSQIETSLKIAAFRKRADELIQRGSNVEGKHKDPDKVNNEEGSSASLNLNGNSPDHRLVLTLYGSAGPQPKQLFSSLQLPTKVPGETKDIVQTLRESGLPTGIATTQILPIQSTGLTDDRTRVHTLGELFPTPSTVPLLQPPKPSKIATTRSSTVGWYHPASADPHSRSGSYFRQPISIGQWLDYSNASATPCTKRKQRDRALSLGATKAPQLDVDLSESESAKLDNLFRSAYSSFAPCKDDAAAIFPAGMIDQIWWQYVGEKSFGRLVQNANCSEDIMNPHVDTSNSIIADGDEEEEFREAVENFDGLVDPSLEPVVEKVAGEKDIDEILNEISDLLRTLNSHQRNRHLNLNSSGRAGGLLNAPDATSLGTPSKPSEPETSIYEILKSQLTLMIAALPPYAVAKLDGDQLDELAISTKMEIQVKDHKGVMEEDEASARAKNLAFSTASTSRPLQPPQHRSGSSSLFGNQYATPRPAAPTQHQYYNLAQTPVRPQPNNLQRPPTTGQAPYPSQRPAAGAPYRPNSYVPPNYQTTRPQQPYTPQPQYQQPLPNYNRPAGQSYQGLSQPAPPAAMNKRYAGQPSYAQQTPLQNGLEYRYGNGANAARQVSPQKPVHSPQTAYNQAQTRPYATPTPSTSQDRRPYLSNTMTAKMVNGESAPLHLPQLPQQQQLGPTNYSTFMTTEQQSSMMERQRAQLAQQQGLQQIARSAAQAGTIGSPSRSQVNGNALTAGL